MLVGDGACKVTFLHLKPEFGISAVFLQNKRNLKNFKLPQAAGWYMPCKGEMRDRHTEGPFG